MNQWLKCVMLVDDDNLTNLLNKIIIDYAQITDNIVIKNSSPAALMYLNESICSKGALPFPELIFLDIFMSQASGWEFINNYKSIQHNCPIKPIIIILTSFEDTATIFKCLSFDEIDDIYFKPLTEEKLITIINEYCCSLTETS